MHSVPWPTAPRGALIFSPSIRRPGLWPAATVSMYGETEFNASICQSFRLFPAADANDTTFNHTCSQSAPCSCHFPYWSGYFSVNLKSRCCAAPHRSKSGTPGPKAETIICSVFFPPKWSQFIRVTGQRAAESLFVAANSSFAPG